ncbi:MAG: choice-of-anchor Q domain-containing protein [Cellvibrio sp.]
MKIISSSLCSLAIALISVSSARAAEFTCNVGDGCLYGAIASANQTDGPDTIRFTAGNHDVSMDYRLGCAPDIVGDITIVGAGSSVTSLDAQGRCAFFRVNVGSSLTLRDIGIHNGSRVDYRTGSRKHRGAAIYNQGRLRVERSIFNGNGLSYSADSQSGGGAIYNAPHAKAYITDTEFLNNFVYATHDGGAILNEGTMTVARSRFSENDGVPGVIVNGVQWVSPNASLVLLDSVIENNVLSRGIKNNAKLTVERTTVSDGDSVEGGGIYNANEMTVRESAIIGNSAIRGGGVYSAKDATSTFINTTISQNHARGKAEGNGIGGGLFNYGGTVYLANSTIAENASQGWGAAIAATSDADGSAFFYMKSSLILGHSNISPCYDFGPNDLPKLFLVENNLITEESNCYAPSATDIVVQDAITFTKVIGRLSDYVGPTPNYVLLPDSPAIDNEGKLCTDFDGMPIVTDQRGNIRTGCDRGAVDSTAKAAPIEIKFKLPGNIPAIQPNSTGSVDLAILSRVDSVTSFRPVSDVDRSSLQLGAGNAVPYKFISQDINGDNIADLVMRLKISDIGIVCGVKTIELRGTILNGATFVSSTAIATTGCSVN